MFEASTLGGNERNLMFEGMKRAGRALVRQLRDKKKEGQDAPT